MNQEIKELYGHSSTVGTITEVRHSKRVLVEGKGGKRKNEEKNG